MSDTPFYFPHRITTPAYVGRFAPSPSGPLHFGSLVSALASYLDAKANYGQWLVRMEDLDPPREQPGAAALILQSLADHGLHWDGAVLYQSQRHDAYQDCLDNLQGKNWVYPCICSRQRLQALDGIYDGYCRNQPVNTHYPHALRLKLYDLAECDLTDNIEFIDLIQGYQQQNLRTRAGDQILKRRDGFYAYQLAVVLDDIAQGITHIIRGSDLLEVTARQLFFFALLHAPAPVYGHVPVVTQENGQKLSKQNQAQPLDSTTANINLWRALLFLGQNPPPDLLMATPAEILAWGKTHWRLDQIKGLARIPDPIG